MSTYINAHQILSEVRIGLGEFNESFMTAAEKLNKHRNDELLRQINRAQDFLYAFIAKRQPSLFTSNTSLTGVNSVFTLPSDFGKVKLFRDDNARKVFNISEDERRRSADTGSERLYYRRGNTLVLDKSGVTKTYDLIYITKPRPIHAGVASAGAATSITLDSNYARKIADTYNGMTIENITQDWVDTIDDYTAARVATISETAAKSDIYGLVSELPEWSHHLIAPRAILQAKASSPIAKAKPTKAEIDLFNEDLITTMREWLIPDETEVDWADMFTQFEPATAPGGMIVAE